MTREEAEPIILDLLKNLRASPNFSAPGPTFDAIDAFLAPKAEQNGSGTVTEVAIPT